MFPGYHTSTMHPRPSLTLKPGRERSLRRFHPWIFSGALEEPAAPLADGAVVEVRTSEGEFVATGLYAPQSLAVRVMSFSKVRDERELVSNAVERAWNLRRGLGFPSATTNAFRLINAEGDMLPGVVADYYAGVVVLQFGLSGMRSRRAMIVDALVRVLGTDLRGLLDRSAESLRAGSGAASDGAETNSEWVVGAPVPEVTISENGLRYLVHPDGGQKSGFYLDQRDNRELVRTLSAGKRVLNLCCYTGGFTLAALAGGATEVVSVDSSEAALALLERNLALNALPREPAAHAAVKADMFQYLDRLTEKFDLVIADPPPFARHRDALDGALKGYRRLNALAYKTVAAGGVLCTFSCTQVVSRADFLVAVQTAAQQTGRRSRLLRELGAAPCHPRLLGHPEGEYLKGLALAVE